MLEDQLMECDECGIRFKRKEAWVVFEDGIDLYICPICRRGELVELEQCEYCDQWTDEMSDVDDMCQTCYDSYLSDLDKLVTANSLYGMRKVYECLKGA